MVYFISCIFLSDPIEATFFCGSCHEWLKCHTGNLGTELAKSLESSTFLNIIGLFQVIMLWELFLSRGVQSHDILLL